MGRLEDSVSRLSATQDALKEAIDAEEAQTDPEIAQAHQENLEVM